MTVGHNSKLTEAESQALSCMLHGAVYATLGNWGKPWGTISAATWRKMFFGAGYKPPLDNHGKNDWKRAAIEQCELEGIILPAKKATRDNAAEAAALAVCWRGVEIHAGRYRPAFQDFLQQRNERAPSGDLFAAVNASKLPALGTLTPLESVNGQLTGDTIAIQNARAEATKSQTQIEAEKVARSSGGRSRGGGGRAGAISEAQREREAVTKLIEQLEYEQSLIGMTDQQREVANALRRAGAAATEEQRAKIAELVEQTYAEREAILASKDAMLELHDASRDVLQGIVSDLRDGKNGADILANALDRIASRLLDSAFDGLFSGGLGKGGLFGGKLIPGILHSGGIAGRDGYGHGRSVSPSVFAGAPRYHNGGIAGLKPDEVPAILQKGERIIPRNASSSGASPVVVNFNPVIDNRGASVEAVARQEKALAKMQGELQSRVEAAVRSAQKRNVKLG
ncbi:hypothetical protein [Agrobacterium pusense]|uniref:hypothetical protein n=1 Tax=Agrobacterium pusense TaxID=648995 RepID=UPI003FD168FE